MGRHAILKARQRTQRERIEETAQPRRTNVRKLQKTGEVGKKVFATPLHFPLVRFQVAGQVGRKMDRMMVSLLHISIIICDLGSLWLLL